LFEQTKSYFEGWKKILISFILQPAVSVTFSVLIFSIYDWGFYGTCKYKAIDIIMPNKSVLRSFFIDVAQADENCKNTLGWWVSDKFDFGDITSITLEKLNKVKATGAAGGIKAIMGLSNTPGQVESVIQNGKMTLDALESLGNYMIDGTFITIPTAPLKGFFQVVTSMLIACFCLYVGYQVSDQLANFAADMTGGISLKALTASPKENFDNIMAAIKAGGGGGAGAGGVHRDRLRVQPRARGRVSRRRRAHGGGRPGVRGDRAGLGDPPARGRPDPARRLPPSAIRCVREVSVVAVRDNNVKG
jgi:type IV secretion system protein VirB6